LAGNKTRNCLAKQKLLYCRRGKTGEGKKEISPILTAGITSPVTATFGGKRWDEGTFVNLVWETAGRSRGT